MNPYKYLQKDSLNLVQLGEKYLSSFPVLGYYCILYVAKKLNAEGKELKSKGAPNPNIDLDLNLLVTKLEGIKNSQGPFKNENNESQNQIQNYLDNFLLQTDNEYMNCNFTQGTIQNFMLYLTLLEVVNVFGEMSEDNVAKSSIFLINGKESTQS